MELWSIDQSVGVNSHGDTFCCGDKHVTGNTEIWFVQTKCDKSLNNKLNVTIQNFTKLQLMCDKNNSFTDEAVIF